MKASRHSQIGLQAFFNQAFAFDEDQIVFAAIADSAGVFQSFVGGTGDEHAKSVPEAVATRFPRRGGSASPPGRYRFRYCTNLEDHVEIQSEEPAIVAEELAHLWIGGVAAHVQWIEMIGQVETADLEPERVFGADLEVA